MCYPVGVRTSVAMGRVNAHQRWRRGLAGVVALAIGLGTAQGIARPRTERVAGERTARRHHRSDDDGSTNNAPTNVLLEPAGAIALPGRGLSLAWSPDG